MNKIITMKQKELAGDIIKNLNNDERKAIIAFGADQYSEGLLKASLTIFKAISASGLIIVCCYAMNRLLRVER